MEPTTPQPRAWPAWLAAGVAAHSIYRLLPYIHEALLLFRAYQPRLGDFFYLFRESAPLAAGLVLFTVSAVLICLRRPFAAWVGVFGFATYLAGHFHERGRMAPLLPQFGLPVLIDSIVAFWPTFLTATLSLAALLLAAHRNRAELSPQTTPAAGMQPLLPPAQFVAPAPSAKATVSATHEAEVALVLYGEGVAAAVIAQMIGVQPTPTPRRGESTLDPLEWRLSAARVIAESVDIAEMASNLVAKLAVHADDIRRAKQTLNLQATLEVDLRLSTDPSVWPPDAGLTAEVIQFLGAIGADVEFDIYRDVDDPDL